MSNSDGLSKCLITVSELSNDIAMKKKMYILDIRKKEDYLISHIKDSIHCEWEGAIEHINAQALSKDKAIIIVCYNGQSSMQIATILSIYDYKAYSLLDGIEGWLEANFQLESL